MGTNRWGGGGSRWGRRPGSGQCHPQLSSLLGATTCGAVQPRPQPQTPRPRTLGLPARPAEARGSVLLSVSLWGVGADAEGGHALTYIVATIVSFLLKQRKFLFSFRSGGDLNFQESICQVQDPSHWSWTSPPSPCGPWGAGRGHPRRLVGCKVPVGG